MPRREDSWEQQRHRRKRRIAIIRRIKNWVGEFTCLILFSASLYIIGWVIGWAATELFRFVIRR